MDNLTILINVSKKKQNRLLEKKNDVNYYIIGENTRKVICNMFDSIGNISNYTDYYAFQTNNRTFKSFSKCTCADKLKYPLGAGQGILIAISPCGELYLPEKDIVDWILSLHDYEILKTENITKEEVVEEPKKQESEKEESEKKEEPKKQESEKEESEKKEEPKEDEKPKEEPKKEEEATGYTGRFWKLFGY
jgi:hypothetical protein